MTNLDLVTDEQPDVADRVAYSVDEAAELLGIGRTLIYDLMRDGDLRSMKLGNRRLVRRAELERFAQSCEVDAA